MTSYNHEKFVTQAIESVLNQTFGNYELIIADDCSRDGSWDIINAYTDSRIRLFRSDKTERGLINKVLKSGMVRGEYVAIHHSDDVWAHHKLEKQVSLLDSAPDVSAVFTKASIIDERGIVYGMDDENPTARAYTRVFDKSDRSRHEWLNYFFHHGNCLCHPSLMIRKECYDELGFYNMSYLQTADYEYWTRLCMKKEIRILPEPLVSFRVLEGGQNTSAQTPEKIIRERFEYYRILGNFLRIDDAVEILTIFPETQQYLRGNDPVAKYLLARAAIDSGTREAKLFGLEILATLMADEQQAENCLGNHHFALSDYFALTGSSDVFSSCVECSGSSNTGVPSACRVEPRIFSDLRWWLNNWRTRLRQVIGR